MAGQAEVHGHLGEVCEKLQLYQEAEKHLLRVSKRGRQRREHGSLPADHVYNFFSLTSNFSGSGLLVV